jgi:hypothetical protein
MRFGTSPGSLTTHRLEFGSLLSGGDVPRGRARPDHDPTPGIPTAPWAVPLLVLPTSVGAAMVRKALTITKNYILMAAGIGVSAKTTRVLTQRASQS